MRIVKLTSPHRKFPLAKEVSLDASGEFTLIPFSEVKWFNADVFEVESLQALSSLLSSIEDDPQVTLIRGIPHPDTNLELKVRKRKYRADEPIQEAPFMDQAIPWVMLDIDKLKLPEGIDVLSEPEKAIQFALNSLPEEFRDASVHWQLSSSSGIKSPGTVSAHLHFWLSEPKTSDEMKRWAERIKKKEQRKLIDAHLFNTVQAHYTANPVFPHGIKDPLEGRRSGFMKGQRGLVQLKWLPEPERSTSNHKPIDSSYTTHGYEQILSELGDDDGDGFHVPIMRAIASFVAVNGREAAETQREALFEDIRRRVFQADSSNHDQATLEQRVSDTTLDGLFDGAIEKYGDKKNQPPHFDVEELTLAEAETKLTDAIEAFGHRVKAYWSDTEEWLEDAPALAIRATAGLGKTSQIINHLIKYNIIELGDIHYYAPRHDLIEQLRADLDEALTIRFKSSEGDKAFSRVNVIKGREQRDEDDLPLCLKSDTAKKVAEAGLNVSTTLCKSGSRQCEHYNTCGYQRQFIDGDSVADTRRLHAELLKGTDFPSFDTLHSETQCLTHAHLFLNTKNRLPKPKLVIVDEAFWRGAVEEICISTNDLLLSATPLAKLIHETLVQLDAPPLLKTLREHEVYPEDLRAEAQGIEDASDATNTLKPDTPTAQIERLLTERTNVLQTPLVLRQLADELELVSRDQSHVLRYEPRDVNTSDAKRDKLVLTRRKRFCVSEDVPVIFIDANANEDILKLFRPNVQVIDIHVQRQATIHQFTDLTFSKNSLVNGKDENELRGQVRDFIERISANGRTLVVATKAVKELLEQEVNNQPKGMLSPPPITFIHFGALRGLNDFSQFDNVVVVGREQPPAYAMEDQARALWWDAEFPIYALPKADRDRPLPVEYRAYRSKTSKTVQVAAHPDRRVQSIIEQGREAESEQALDRLRLLRSEDKQRQVYILSNVPLNVTVDYGWGWKQYQDIVIIWSACNGDIPTKPKELIARVPEVATSQRTAERLSKELKTAKILIENTIRKVAECYKTDMS